MTSFAYQVHDALVLHHGIDPSSDEYYAAIETSVSSRFPDRWAELQDPGLPQPVGLPGRSGLLGAAAGLAGSSGLSRQQQACMRSQMVAADALHAAEPAVHSGPRSGWEQLPAPEGDAKSITELQLQYNSQRMAVVEELRRAKEEAGELFACQPGDRWPGAFAVSKRGLLRFRSGGGVAALTDIPCLAIAR